MLRRIWREEDANEDAGDNASEDGAFTFEEDGKDWSSETHSDAGALEATGRRFVIGDDDDEIGLGRAAVGRAGVNRSDW